ncbi:GntR family transcriptional regulator [Nesterenkonia aerolata]|uniref:GntR family transcriptional regulator n=1 Tax=Nesterenkonia aerolata TaxID=3074079 RepID=A0ABU2DNJ2_9MICC|nr:GntR family transcriptional regulator [Nesterenkonia sp. LY-0111]MDR8018008.1 GntR family transcriptional regulator [Nesterenkonia sp. LY-0111]
MTPPSWTKTGYAYEQVRRRVMTGELHAGQPLPLTQLAEEFGISMTPMREALRRLEAEGLVVIDTHKNARVTSLSAQEATHLFELREKLDPMASKLAAVRRTQDDVVSIQQALRNMRPLQDEKDLDALVSHREFHRAVYRASHNPLLIHTLEGLWDKADRYRQVGIAARRDDDADRNRVHREHEEIAEAVIGGEPDAAESWMLTHVRRSLGRRAIDVLASSH